MGLIRDLIEFSLDKWICYWIQESIKRCQTQNLFATHFQHNNVKMIKIKTKEKGFYKIFYV